MTKHATKVPKETKSILTLSDSHAEVWYAKPIPLGKIDFRNGSWYTRDGMRFGSARDAMNYLIKLSEVGKTVTDPTPVATKVETESEAPKVKAKTIRAAPSKAPSALTKEVIDFIKAHPEVLFTK